MAYIIIYIGCDIVYVLVMPYIILYIIKIVNITVTIFSIVEAKFDLFQAPIWRGNNLKVAWFQGLRL